VLCYHSNQIYEAKCVRTPSTEGELGKYLIHYSGWSKSWDEWTNEDRILKYTEQNLQKQKEVSTAAMVAEKKRAIIKEPMRREQPRRKRNKGEDDEKGKSGVKLSLGEELKKVLLKDRELVCAQKHLVKLPAAVTASKIFSDYVQYQIQIKSVSARSGVCQDVVNGLKSYFNTLLTTELLYKQELAQNQELGPGVYSDVYGVEHLVRLLCCIGRLLSYSEFDDNSVALLQNHLQDFTEFVKSNSATYFASSNYQGPVPV